MTGWIQSLFSRSTRAPEAPRSAPSRPTTDEIEAFERIVGELQGVGLTLRTVTDADREAKIAALRDWLGPDWAGAEYATLSMLQAGPALFETALFEQDNSFDVVDADEYAAVIFGIAKLAASRWRVDGVTVEDAERPGEPIDLFRSVKVSLISNPATSAFELQHAKYFDWSLVFRLNERLPAGVAERFAIFLDGNATIVFLTPDEIGRLNALCDVEFFHEDARSA